MSNPLQVTGRPWFNSAGDRLNWVLQHPGYSCDIEWLRAMFDDAMAAQHAAFTKANVRSIIDRSAEPLLAFHAEYVRGTGGTATHPNTPASAATERQSHPDGPRAQAASGGHPPNYFPDEAMAMARERRVEAAIARRNTQINRALSTLSSAPQAPGAPAESPGGCPAQPVAAPQAPPAPAPAGCGAERQTASPPPNAAPSVPPAAGGLAA